MSLKKQKCMVSVLQCYETPFYHWSFTHPWVGKSLKKWACKAVEKRECRGWEKGRQRPIKHTPATHSSYDTQIYTFDLWRERKFSWGL